jgi:hypothetical protein
MNEERTVVLSIHTIMTLQGEKRYRTRGMLKTSSAVDEEGCLRYEENNTAHGSNSMRCLFNKNLASSALEDQHSARSQR